MSFILHWQTTSDPSDQSTAHASLADAFTAEAAKAVVIVMETWFKLWIEDGVVTYHQTEKTGAG